MTMETSRLDRRAFLVGGAMVAAAGTAAARMPEPNRPSIDPEKFKKMMPDTVGQWHFQQTSGLVLAPDDALSARLYDNLVTRAYANVAGQVVMVLVAYKNFQNGVLQIAYQLEQAAAATYQFALGQIINQTVAGAAGSIEPVEAQHSVVLGQLLDLNPSDYLPAFQSQTGALSPQTYALS